MKQVKIVIAALAVMLTLGVSLRLCQAEKNVSRLVSAFRILEEGVAYDLNTCRQIVEINTYRQNHLEDVLLHSEGFRLTMEQIHAYNSKMKTRLVRRKTVRKNTSMGGE